MIWIFHPKSELSALLHGELDPGTAARVGAHLDRCERCRRELDAVRLASELAGTLGVRASKTTFEAIESRLGEPAGGSEVTRAPRRGVRYAVAGAMIFSLSALAAGVLILRPSG